MKFDFKILLLYISQLSLNSAFVITIYIFFTLNITSIKKKIKKIQCLTDAVSSNFICMKINREHSSGSLLYKPNPAWAQIQTISTYLATLALIHTCITYYIASEGSIITNCQTSSLNHHCVCENNNFFGVCLAHLVKNKTK